MAVNVTCQFKGFGIINRKKILEGFRPGKPLKKGEIKPNKPIPEHIPKPEWYRTGGQSKLDRHSMRQCIHSAQELKKMRASCKLAANILNEACKIVKPGITTADIDELVFDMTIKNGAYPSPLNYGKFPKSVCTSVNECVCHGIPDSTVLRYGDIVNIDVTCFKDGHHGDTSRTVIVGKTSKYAELLIEVTDKCLSEAIKICAPGVKYRQIGEVIEAYASQYNMAICDQFVGHGVGRTFHADPYIIHNRNKSAGHMVPNQTFTIEPILLLGEPRLVEWADKWTQVAKDGCYSAQAEHTILITDKGHEILTLA